MLFDQPEFPLRKSVVLAVHRYILVGHGNHFLEENPLMTDGIMQITVRGLAFPIDVLGSVDEQPICQFVRFV